MKMDTRKIIEDKINKYIEESGTPNNNYIHTNSEGGVIEENLKDMSVLQENRAWRLLRSDPNIFGSIKIFIKKVLRKCIKFYIEPIADQQTEFNIKTTETLTVLNRKVSTEEGKYDWLIRDAQNNGSRLDNIETQNTQIENDNTVTKEKILEVEKIYETLKKKYEDDYQNLLSNYQVLVDKYNKIKEDYFSIKEDYFSIQEEFLGVKGKYIDIREDFVDIKRKCIIAEDRIHDVQMKFDSNTFIEVAKETVKTELKREGIAVTSSQSGEDAIIRYILNMVTISPADITYLDLGANHAISLSNTYTFYKDGARGVLVEANPDLVQELKGYRPEDIVINRLVSTGEDVRLPFYILNGDGLSSFDKESIDDALSKNHHLKLEKVVEVQSISFKEIQEKYFQEAPILLDVDIEGYDFEIIKAIDYELWRPLIILVETIDYSADIVLDGKRNDIVEFLKTKGYVEYAFTGINSVMVDKKRVDEILRVKGIKQ